MEETQPESSLPTMMAEDVSQDPTATVEVRHRDLMLQVAVAWVPSVLFSFPVYFSPFSFFCVTGKGGGDDRRR